MSKTERDARLIAVVGPTASGKTDLALQIAQRYRGEIIAADSRTIYKGMDIGTAKPTAAQQARIKHHCLDLITPDRNFSAAEFKAHALDAICDIRARGKLPILVGGTGLYTYAVLYDYQFPAGASNELRMQLEKMPITELVAQIKQLDPERAAEIDLNNPRRVIRAIETAGKPRTSRPKLPPNWLLVGLNPGQQAIESNIIRRTSAMFKAGLTDEVKALVSHYGPDCEPLNTVGYREIIDNLTGKTTLAEAEELIMVHTRQLMKRQMTWFKRSPDIMWAQSAEEALRVAQKFMTKAV
ncbi:MAG TPA: tRNA (adenosine(37)-N6)-dimethylallyltransferase MiaA [Candidatus Dormibacteraeota bacterium]|nr:tRNA (adenosine(37)-N6)-dimethylallyltransferase MiaA [Candidatus Dormibacteraeota bacterium]